MWTQTLAMPEVVRSREGRVDVGAVGQRPRKRRERDELVHEDVPVAVRVLVPATHQQERLAAHDRAEPLVDLRQDDEVVYWRRIMTFLGLDAAQQEKGARRFWQNSLFGGLPRLGNRHVRSGAVAQWRREFTPALANAFLQRFPGLLQSLGYETNDGWVRDLDDGPMTGMGMLSEFRQFAARPLETFAGLARSPLKF